MDSKQVSRRTFAASLSVAAVGAVVSPESAKAQFPLSGDLRLPDELVDVTVHIVWVPTGAPVLGASVFKHVSNELLGKTDKRGNYRTKQPNGTVLRLVEPKYGQQQALRVVQGEREPRSPIRVCRVGEGWTIG
jgi:hypothetical protein